MLNDLERKQLETNRGLLGNALAEQAYMKIIMLGLKKLFMQVGGSELRHHPYDFEMTTCESLIKLYDLNNHNASILLDEYDRVLKEDDAERAKEEKDSSTRCETCKNYESNSDITGWCSACPGTVTKGMNSKGTCAAYEKREEK